MQELEKLNSILDEVKKLKTTEPKAPNFFSIGGASYFENPTSDIIAIFMGGEDGRTPNWLARALAECVLEKTPTCDLSLNDEKWELVKTSREVSVNDNETNTKKRLDLVVETSSMVLGIEFKINASAGHNPFDVYDVLLKERAADGRIILKCVLRPTTYAEDVKSDWPVVGYDELIDKAKAQYGQNIACEPVSKWQFFYTEFLQHLYALAHPEAEYIMEQQAFDFVVGNFSALKSALKKANNLLVSFHDHLKSSGEKSVRAALQSLDITTSIEVRTESWPRGEKALKFHPSCWGGHSNVVLVYCEDEDIVSDTDKPVCFFIRAYIEKDSTHIQLADLSKELCRLTHHRLNEWFDDEKNDESEHCWLENEKNRKWLGFDAYPKDSSITGTLKALQALTKWLQLNAFTKA